MACHVTDVTVKSARFIGVLSSLRLEPSSLRSNPFKQTGGHPRKQAIFLHFLEFLGAVQALRQRATKTEKGRKGRFRPIFRKGGQTPLKRLVKPPFVTPHLLRRPKFQSSSHSLVQNSSSKTLWQRMICGGYVFEQERIYLLLFIKLPRLLAHQPHLEGGLLEGGPQEGGQDNDDLCS